MVTAVCTGGEVLLVRLGRRALEAADVDLFLRIDVALLDLDVLEAVDAGRRQPVYLVAGDRVLAEPAAELLQEGIDLYQRAFTTKDGREKNFVSPIRTTPWGTIKSPAEYEPPSQGAMQSQELAHEPDALNIEGGLPALTPDQLKKGVV